MNEHNDIPRKLIESLDVPQLRLLASYLNRTRRRLYAFYINGRGVFTSRKWARDAVVAEIAARPPEKNRMPRSDPLGVWATPPGQGRTAIASDCAPKRRFRVA